MDYEETIVGIIANSGSAHSYAMEAIALAKQRKFDKADEAINQAHAALTEAQKIHGVILSESITDTKGTPLLTVHAEDQIMAAFTAIDMAVEFIDTYRVLFDLKDEIAAIRSGL